MTEVWSYRIQQTVPMPDLDGFDVEATDGHIGKIDEANNETGSSCLVVDTGFWIFGKKRMIPAGAVERIDLEDRKVHVGMTKDEIKSAPDYDESRRNEDDYRRQHDDYYGRWAR